MQPAWKQEWRRRAGGVLTAVALVLAGWFSASQSFVTESNGRLVHPSPYTWVFFVPLVIGLGALYLFVATYRPGLLPTRWVPVDHSTMYTLALVGSIGTVDPAPTRGLMIVSAGPVFMNNGREVIAYKVELLTAKHGNVEVDNSRFPTSGGRLLPGHSRSYRSPGFEIPIIDSVTIEIAYRVTYGPVSGFPRYLRTHKINVTLYDIDVAARHRGTSTWDELEEETDTIIDPASASQ